MSNWVKLGMALCVGTALAAGGALAQADGLVLETDGRLVVLALFSIGDMGAFTRLCRVG